MLSGVVATDSATALPRPTGAEIAELLAFLDEAAYGRGWMECVAHARTVRALVALAGRGSLDTLAAEIGAWQAVTFPHATPESVTEHLRREAVELAAAPTDPDEIADVFHLIVAAANAAGVSLEDAVRSKFERNRARRWKAPDAMGVVEHEVGV